MNLIPLVLYAAAMVAYAWHFAQRNATVGRSAGEAGGHVAQTAADQARDVVAETARQARDLLGEASGHARDQASVQQQKAASQLRSVADELHEMTVKGGQSSVATEVAQQAAERIHGVASWLEQREPAAILHQTFRRLLFQPVSIGIS